METAILLLLFEKKKKKKLNHRFQSISIAAFCYCCFDGGDGAPILYFASLHLLKSAPFLENCQENSFFLLGFQMEL
jgi:hypothetical protein